MLAVVPVGDSGCWKQMFCKVCDQVWYKALAEVRGVAYPYCINRCIEATAIISRALSRPQHYEAAGIQLLHKLVCRNGET